MLQPIDKVMFTGADFCIQHYGVCRMNPELARRVAQLTLQQLRGRQRIDSVCPCSVTQEVGVSISVTQGTYRHHATRPPVANKHLVSRGVI